MEKEVWEVDRLLCVCVCVCVCVQNPKEGRIGSKGSLLGKYLVLTAVSW